MLFQFSKRRTPWTNKTTTLSASSHPYLKSLKKTINDQLRAHFENIFDPFLSAFRPGMGCQSTLLRLMDDWRQGLDRHEYVAAILMDLSKAFDCLPRDLLLGKLRAYGLNTSACALVRSYLSNRKQRVKLGPHHGEWANTSKGVPQGSILGPLLFIQHLYKRHLQCTK